VDCGLPQGRAAADGDVLRGPVRDRRRRARRGAGRIAAVAALGDAAQDLGAPGRDAVFGLGLVQAQGLCGAPTGGATVETVAAEEGEAATPAAFSPAGQ